MSAAVILAVRAPNEAEIATAVGAHSGLVVARRCADLAEAIAAAHAGIGEVIVVSEHAELDRAVIRRLEKAGLAVVGVPSDAKAREVLLGLGVATVLAPSLPADEVAAAAHEAATEPRSGGPIEDVPSEDLPSDEPERARGRVVAVWGPTGAPGRTFIATNLAAEAGRLDADVLLVDADTYGGAVASALGVVDEAPGVAALARAALRGEPITPLLERHAARVGPGVRLLSGISRADRWPELPAAALDAVWEAARDSAGLVVVDTGFAIEPAEDLGGRDRNAATLSALVSADVIVIVGSSEPLGIQRLVQAISDLSSIPETADARRVVVVNKVRASVAGALPERAVADALARYASVAETWTVPYDARACDAATLAGAALVETSPRSAARRAITQLARHVVEASASVTQSTPIA